MQIQSVDRSCSASASASSAFGVVLKKRIKNGRLINPVSTSAMGWEICIPVSPQTDVVTTRMGIKVSPLRNSDNNDAVHALRML